MVHSPFNVAIKGRLPIFLIGRLTVSFGGWRVVVATDATWNLAFRMKVARMLPVAPSDAAESFLRTRVS